MRCRYILLIIFLFMRVTGAFAQGGSIFGPPTAQPGAFTTITASGEIFGAAATAGAASLNLPQGTTPSAPANGDVWTTSGGLFVRIAGSTVGPLGTGGGGGGGTPGGSSGQIQYNNSGAFGGFTASGDATINSSTGAVTVSQIGGITISLGGPLTLSGAHTLTMSTTGNTTVTLPTTGTLISTGNIAYSQFPTLSANQVLGALTATTPSGLSLPSCGSSNNALSWTSGTGFGCNTISSSGSPGGGNTNVQYNSSGSFGANNAFTYNGTGVISLGTSSSSAGGVAFSSSGGGGTITLGPPSTSLTTATLTLPDATATLATTANIATAIPSAATTTPVCGSGAAGAVAACSAITTTGKITTPASTTGAAPMNVPQGTAPTSPSNGDVWTTSGGLYVQIAGSTVGPLGGGGGTIPSGNTTNPLCQTGTTGTAAGCGVIATANDIGSAIYTLTDASSIATNAANGNLFVVTLGGNRALANPTNLIAGHYYTWFPIQDGTGSRTLTYGTYFLFFPPYSSSSPPVLPTTAGAGAAVGCYAKSTTALWCSFAGAPS
jgi:hypothetical protein